VSFEVAARDPLDVRFVWPASGLLREFNQAGVLSAADVHVARHLAALVDEPDDRVLLASALAVRAPRLGHVHVDLATIRDTAAVDAEEPIDLGALAWPELAEWTAAVRASDLVAAGDDFAGGVRPLRLVGTWLYLDRYWAEEVQVADSLLAMSAGGVAGVDVEALTAGLARLFPLEPDGLEALAAGSAVRRRFTVVAGGPGTGKTTTVARIVALLCEQAAASGSDPPLIALAAPTGKAATRLHEALTSEAARMDVGEEIRDQLLDLEASTIHRLLGWRAGSNSRFRHHRGQRLPHDVVIVDETSMVSLSLMARLIEALRADGRLVLVGDPGQLASIEAGAVLGDIVGTAADGGARSEQAVARGIVVLERGHRFGGGIAQLATAIRLGDADGVLAMLREPPPELIWIAADTAAAEDSDALAPVREGALAAAGAIFAAAWAGSAPDALQALGAFRILCAHRRGPYGVASWTARMEGWLAAAQPGFSSDERWYVGRPLLVNENDYELRLHNGDTGVLVRGAGDRVSAAFARGGEIVSYSPSRLSAVETVYAMTIHKSQGSQFDAAAVLLPEVGSSILTRELLYTAATRARRQLILAGSEAAIREAVARPVARASGLGWRLWGSGGPPSSA